MNAVPTQIRPGPQKPQRQPMCDTRNAVMMKVRASPMLWLVHQMP